MYKPSFLLVLCLLICAAHPSLAQSDNNPPPLRRVTLYKHGVGYFERQGRVTGDQQVTFLFDAAQMNDVLKSLVVLDRPSRPINVSKSSASISMAATQSA